MTQQYHFWAYTLRKPDLKETRAPQCTSPFNYGGRVYVLSSLYIIKLHLCSHMALILRIGNSEAMRKAPDCPASSQGTVLGSICFQRPLTSLLCFLPFPHSCSLLGLGVQGRGKERERSDIFDPWLSWFCLRLLRQNWCQLPASPYSPADILMAIFLGVSPHTGLIASPQNP